MKDSGVEWLGEIPTNWDVKRFKYLATIRSGQVDPTLNEFRQFRLVAPNHIQSGTGLLFGASSAEEQGAQSGKVPFKTGDVLYSKIRPNLHKVCLAPFDGVCSSDIYPIVPNGRMAPYYLLYTMLSTGFHQLTVLDVMGATIPRIDHESLMHITFPLPPLAEQRAIAAYLDRETAQIDALITKTVQLNALLREKRTALISHAVTKGLDPAAPLKDSGVEWLGEIPAHWDVWKPSHAFQQVASGTTPNTNDLRYFDGNVSWVTTSELRENTIVATKAHVTELALTDHPMLKVYLPGTLLIAMYGATIGRLGILGIPACTNQACCALADSSVLETRFAFYSLYIGRDHLIRLSSGGGQPNINQEKIRSLKLAVPPLAEQRAIAAHLDCETTKIDALIAKNDQLIALLREKRTSLISAAVTGKIDLRNEA